MNPIGALPWPGKKRYLPAFCSLRTSYTGNTLEIAFRPLRKTRLSIGRNCRKRKPHLLLRLHLPVARELPFSIKAALVIARRFVLGRHVHEGFHICDV